MKNSSLTFQLLFLLLLVISCTDSELVENWKNPDIDSFQAQKVLVLAISNDLDNRTYYERKLVDKLREKGVNALDSEAFFSAHYISRPHTEDELELLESQMLLEDYDAILVSKVVGAEDKVTLVQGYRNFNRTFENFGDDYYSNQSLYNQNDSVEHYTVYHAQSVLYCICPEKERQIIWRASIDVTKSNSDKKAIKDYINMLVWALEEQDLLIL